MRGGMPLATKCAYLARLTSFLSFDVFTKLRRACRTSDIPLNSTIGLNKIANLSPPIQPAELKFTAASVSIKKNNTRLPPVFEKHRVVWPSRYLDLEFLRNANKPCIRHDVCCLLLAQKIASCIHTRKVRATTARDLPSWSLPLLSPLLLLLLLPWSLPGLPTWLRELQAERLS